MGIKDDLKFLKDHGVDCSCRCPKPCMPHSDHYRGEKLRAIKRSLNQEKPKKYIIVDPDGDAVFNYDDQNHQFKSISACWAAAKEFLAEPDSVDLDGKEYTKADESGWKVEEFRIFKEI